MMMALPNAVGRHITLSMPNESEACPDTINGMHEPIIDPDKFFKIQKVIPKIVYSKTKIDRAYLLRGILRCGHHDCAMTP
jgi:hypothetical protein